MIPISQNNFLLYQFPAITDNETLPNALATSDTPFDHNTAICRTFKQLLSIDRIDEPG